MTHVVERRSRGWHNLARPPFYALVGTIGVGLALGQSGLMPSNIGYTCPFKALTGYNCPGCGMSRCVNALAHGDIGAAFHYNAFLFLLIPVLAWGWWAWFRADSKGQAIPAPRLWVIYSLVAIALVFWVVRNIPGLPLIGLT